MDATKILAAMLFAVSASEFTRPTISSMIFGLLPAAAMRDGFSMCVGMTGILSGAGHAAKRALEDLAVPRSCKKSITALSNSSFRNS